MFGLNNAQLIGRLGADVTINHLANGGRVANLSIATDESYIDKNSGDRVDRTEWHRVVTFQAGLVEMFERHARKGRLVYVAGKLQTRRWKKDGEDSDRFSTEIILVPGGRVQFLDKGAGSNGNAEPAMTAAAAETPMQDTERDPVLNGLLQSQSSLDFGRRFSRRPFFYSPPESLLATPCVSEIAPPALLLRSFLAKGRDRCGLDYSRCTIAMRLTSPPEF